jgi:hypothetical protein
VLPAIKYLRCSCYWQENGVEWMKIRNISPVTMIVQGGSDIS